jgi:hypothetical protein
MELGLLSNMLVNPQPYWQAYVPPLFSAIAGYGNDVRIVEPPPVAWARRKAWTSVRSQIKACDTLFWLQLSARPATEIHLASLNRLGARRANFVIDAWKPAVSKIGIAATIERLDPCFIAYLEATTELKRRFPLGKFVWLPHAGNPRKEGKPNFAFYVRAIGEDYRELEARQVVEIMERSPGRFTMRLLKKDVGELALTIIRGGAAAQEVVLMGGSPARAFRGPHITRTEVRVKNDIPDRRFVLDTLDRLRSGD